MSTIKDIIKSSVYESFAGGTGLSFRETFLILGVSCLVGLYIYAVYKLFSRSTLYSKDLNITMAGMSLLISAIMIAMQSNLLVSLGMVGALSIVRFRTAVKNPMDLLYLFWAISAGIICGVGLYVLAIVLSVLMTVLIFVLNRIPQNKAPYVLVVKAEVRLEQEELDDVLKRGSKSFSESSVVVKNGVKELIYEVSTKDKVALVDALSVVPGVLGVSLIEHHGEMRG